MGWRFRFRAAWILSAFAIYSAVSIAQQGVVDLDGRAANPFAEEPGKVVVLIFLRRDCPISGRYAPSIQQISKRYSDRVSFWLIYPDRSENSPAIRRSLADFGYQLPALRDPDRFLVKLGHVQITPEAAVFDRSHHLVYDGRIDDWYVDVTRARPSPTTHELEEAIRAAMAGAPVAKSEVRGVGCYISDLP